MRVVKGICVSHDWLISVRVKCEMPYFNAMKCALSQASFSIELLCQMKVIGVRLLNNESIVQIRVKFFRRPFRGRYILDDYTY